MARLARIAVAGLPHHLIQRAAGAAEVFRDARDCALLRAHLLEHTRALHLAVHAYVLLPDRVHLLLTPQEADAPARLMQAIGRRFVRAYNRHHGRVGPLWRGRFLSSVVDPGRDLLLCMRYLETLPVRGGLAAAPEDYPWSSGRHHLGIEADPLVTDPAAFWALGNTPFERQAAYRRLLDEPLAPVDEQRLREAAQRGRAVGSPEFLRTLASRVGRAVGTPSQRGRPRKAPV